ncbi:MAG: T9SS type A sorting domain-containing protein [Bacteroidetes bacterium]|nr:T9SS type A sorting domain-containing protein [Bacteroidota bacterium]
MKKLLFFILFLWQVNSVKAQTFIYHPFPSDSAIWKQDVVETMCSGYCYTHQIKMKGDTVIASQSYKKLGPSYPLRQDVASKKVYLYHNSGKEYLLYDFSLSVGDTLKNWWGATAWKNPSHVYTVSAIDSIFINGNYRKQFHITLYGGGWTTQIIEGIGSKDGLLLTFLPFEHYERLVCFQANNLLIYSPGSTYSNCNDLVSVPETQFDDKLSIYPNPSNGKFQLTSNDMKERIFEITDVLGSVILKSEIKNETTEMDLSAQSKGIYFVKISDTKGNSIIKKIIKE